MIAEEQHHAKRLDMILLGLFPSVSRSFIRKVCDDNHVYVNGTPQKAGYKMKVGDSIDVKYDFANIGVVEDIDIPILYEDNHVVVVDKPSGVLSHALSKFHTEPSVASFLRSHQAKNRKDTEADPNIRFGIVHRLDRHTSGVMICAKSQLAMKHLQKQFAERKTKKTYHAVVMPPPKSSKATIDIPIARNPKAPATFRGDINGKSAQTQYRVISYSASSALLELLPYTGRTHQLRVHMRYIDSPIVGDVLYGGSVFERLLLHASSLQISLPGDIDRVFESKVPKIFEEFVRDN
jgi:23S rRNA pseudouridine1911/1915/1917 synthase